MKIIVYENQYFDKEIIQTMITLFVWNYVVFRQLWLAKGFDDPSKLHFYRITSLNTKYEDIYKGVHESIIFLKRFNNTRQREKKNREAMEKYLNVRLEEYYEEHLKYRRKLVSKKLEKL